MATIPAAMINACRTSAQNHRLQTSLWETPASSVRSSERYLLIDRSAMHMCYAPVVCIVKLYKTFRRMLGMLLRMWCRVFLLPLFLWCSSPAWGAWWNSLPGPGRTAPYPCRRWSAAETQSQWCCATRGSQIWKKQDNVWDILLIHLVHYINIHSINIHLTLTVSSK